MMPGTSRGWVRMPSCCVLVWVSCARVFVGGPAAAPTSRQSSAPPWEAPGSGLNHHELERLQLRDAAMEMFYHGYDNVRGSSVYGSQPNSYCTSYAAAAVRNMST